MQSGGWTIDWQGVKGHITVGTTILAGITQTVSANTHVEYSPPGEFKKFKDAQGNPEIADVGIAVVGEGPYAVVPLWLWPRRLRRLSRRPRPPPPSKFDPTPPGVTATLRLPSKSMTLLVVAQP